MIIGVGSVKDVSFGPTGDLTRSIIISVSYNKPQICRSTGEND